MQVRTYANDKNDKKLTSLRAEIAFTLARISLITPSTLAVSQFSAEARVAGAPSSSLDTEVPPRL